MRWGNLILGALGLAVLQGIVSTGGAASNIGGFLGNAGKAVAWFIDPSVPAFKTTTPPASTTPSTGAAVASTPISPSMGQPTSPSFPGPSTPGVTQTVV